MEYTRQNLSAIFSNFRIEDEVLDIHPFGSGHINDTFKVAAQNKNYLLQRINHSIFKNVEGLTKNLVGITNFLEEKIASEESQMQVLYSYKTNKDKFIHIDQDGKYWRVFDFIENAYSFDRAENADIAFEGGHTFGWFVRMLSDYPAGTLIETIPDFHNADYRIKAFKKSVLDNKAGRAGSVKPIIDELLMRVEEMTLIHQLGKEGKIPVRVTHNDTKINNILFNEGGKGICVIDLDTVMPGYVHFDFGDAIRTFTNTGDEDDDELDKISMDINLYKAFTKGFLSETKNILNPAEIEFLAFSAKYITYEQTIRFLTDFLNGDIYYKVKSPGHNLIRAKAQFALLESMEGQYEEMQRAIRERA
ncbi:MAG: aminoglycoside phosphotransferase family protein [Bacteroidales bacterium]|nr:aminoglycoside phosphotransferase family protein [Bacteroidales bacterium]